MVEPSGDIAMCRTLSECPSSSATFTIWGYFQMVSSLCAKPWEETSSLYSDEKSREQT